MIGAERRRRWSDSEKLSIMGEVGVRGATVSHEDVLNRLASNAGTVAAATTLPIAMMAGKLSAKFEADPLGVLSSGKIGSAALHGAQTTAKEAVEETIQEAGNQFATNVGLNWAGEDVALDRGVAQGAAAGFLGGIGGVAGMQGPGVALGSIKEVVKPVLGGLSNVTDKVLAASEAILAMLRPVESWHL